MAWNIDFITEENFKLHVKETIDAYKKNIESYDFKKFNQNIIDPIKMVFDQKIYNKDWETIVSDEILRQIDKSNANEIGYFHQNIFKYINQCQVPKEGWDIIYNSNGTYIINDNDDNEIKRIETIFIEAKNKHNTMNSSSKNDTYIKMQEKVKVNRKKKKLFNRS